MIFLRLIRIFRVIRNISLGPIVFGLRKVYCTNFALNPFVRSLYNEVRLIESQVGFKSQDFYAIK